MDIFHYLENFRASIHALHDGHVSAVLSVLCEYSGANYATQIVWWSSVPLNWSIVQEAACPVPLPASESSGQRRQCHELMLSEKLHLEFQALNTCAAGGRRLLPSGAPKTPPRDFLAVGLWLKYSSNATLLSCNTAWVSYRFISNNASQGRPWGAGDSTRAGPMSGKYLFPHSLSGPSLCFCQHCYLF